MRSGLIDLAEAETTDAGHNQSVANGGFHMDRQVGQANLHFSVGMMSKT